ncbi:hypothetical protein Taro_042188, partial [Colocasia esculenta]|nr:hypothetical protein [Colocasia esculenta]
SFDRPTQYGNPIRISSVRTHHFHPPGRVGVNSTPIISLFGILDPRVACSDTLPWTWVFFKLVISTPNQIWESNKDSVSSHTSLSHTVVSEQTARQSDPYLGFWTPVLIVLILYLGLVI